MESICRAYEQWGIFHGRTAIYGTASREGRWGVVGGWGVNRAYSDLCIWSDSSRSNLSISNFSSSNLNLQRLVLRTSQEVNFSWRTVVVEFQRDPESLIPCETALDGVEHETSLYEPGDKTALLTGKVLTVPEMRLLLPRSLHLTMQCQI